MSPRELSERAALPRPRPSLERSGIYLGRGLDSEPLCPRGGREPSLLEAPLAGCINGGCGGLESVGISPPAEIGASKMVLFPRTFDAVRWR